MTEREGARPGARPGDRFLPSRRRTKLPRTLGAGALFSACYGNVGSSIYYGLGVTAAFALGLTPLALILAGLIFVTTALNYAEGTAALPHAGGSSSFARRAFNQPAGFLVGWIQLLNYTATVAISSYTAISYLAVLGNYVSVFRLLREPQWRIGAAVVLVALLIAVNIVGIQESSVVNLTLALLDLVTQLALVLLGVFLLLNLQVVLHNIHWGVAPTWGSFLASISIAMVTYTGIETISNMSEEARNPGRTVPRATYAVIVAVLFVSAFLPTIGMSVFPVHLDPVTHQYTTDLATKWQNDPVAGIVAQFRPQALAFWAGVWVAILAFTILVIATNAGLIGLSRLSYSLAVNDLFPKPFARLHPKFKTPYLALIVFGTIGALLLLPDRIVQMAAVYSLAATFAFCTAHLSVMRLRYVEPAMYRPYRMPLNIKFGRASIPVLSVVGALAIGAVFTQLLTQNIAASSVIFVLWLAAGVVAFVAYRRFRHQPIWEPLEQPPPPELRRKLTAGAPVRPSEYVRLRRREHAAPAAPAPAQEPAVVTLPRRVRIAIAGGLGLASVAVIVIDLSPLDPTGPGLGWSPGFVVVFLVAAGILIRSRVER
ncbi:MAG: APC family permease [Candidatus Dormibacteraeota bacterium]|nr:APC family permease [Candidatus Dormibacteraeota bacterium]